MEPPRLDAVTSGRTHLATWGLGVALLAVVLLAPSWALAASAALGVFVLAAATAVAARHTTQAAVDDDGRARRRVALATLACAGLMSMLMTSLIPPLQSPDENSHLRRAYSLMDGVFFISPNSRAAPVNLEVDAGLERFTGAWLRQLATKPENRATQGLESFSREQHWTNEEAAMFDAGAAYFPVLYWPAASGLGMARAMNQPVWVANAWARVAMLLVSLLAIGLALAIARAGFHALCATALLPMAWAQFGSVNLDSMTISLGVLVVAMLSAGVYGARHPRADGYPPWVRAGAWSLLGILVVSKPVFLALMVPPLFWSLRPHARLNLVPMLLILAALAAWMIHMAQSFVDVRLQPGASAFARLGEALLSPIDTLQLFVATLVQHHAFYWKSMVGILGWLDTPLPGAMYAYAAVLMGAALLADASSPNPANWQDRSAFGIAAIAYVAATLLILWVAWTPAGARVIDGVQGRYFLPILPLAALVVGTGRRRGPMASNFFMLVAMGYMVLVAIDLPRVLLYRYWL